jgi:hypothetical protein
VYDHKPVRIAMPWRCAACKYSSPWQGCGIRSKCTKTRASSTLLNGSSADTAGACGTDTGPKTGRRRPAKHAIAGKSSCGFIGRILMHQATQ